MFWNLIAKILLDVLAGLVVELALRAIFTLFSDKENRANSVSFA
jgi:hypothetical protein